MSQYMHDKGTDKLLSDIASAKPAQGWKVVAIDNGEDIRIIDKDTENLDVVAVLPLTGDVDYDNEVTIPRAKLIAAAPDLLHACREAVNHNGCVKPEYRIPTSLLRVLVAAIARAGGAS